MCAIYVAAITLLTIKLINKLRNRRVVSDNRELDIVNKE